MGRPNPRLDDPDDLSSAPVLRLKNESGLLRASGLPSQALLRRGGPSQTALPAAIFQEAQSDR